MLAQIGEIEDLVNMAQEVMGGNVGIEVERVEQTRFAAALASHHPGLAVERSHPSIAAGALCSRCFSTESPQIVPDQPQIPSLVRQKNRNCAAAGEHRSSSAALPLHRPSKRCAR